MARNSNNKATGTHLIQHFLQKVIMDKIVLGIVCIGDDVVPERDIGNGKIKRVLRKVCALKSLIDNVSTIRRVTGDLC